MSLEQVGVDIQGWEKRGEGRAELPQELRAVFQGFGCGRLAVETDIGVACVCPTADGACQLN